MLSQIFRLDLRISFLCFLSFATQNIRQHLNMYLSFTLLLCSWLWPLFLPSQGKLYWHFLSHILYNYPNDAKSVYVFQMQEKKDTKSTGDQLWGGHTGGSIILLTYPKFIVVQMCSWIKTVWQFKLLVALQTRSAGYLDVHSYIILH